MTLLLVFNELDMSWLPLFWLDISRIVFGYQGGADSLLKHNCTCTCAADIYKFHQKDYPDVWNSTAVREKTEVTKVLGYPMGTQVSSVYIGSSGPTVSPNITSWCLVRHLKPWSALVFLPTYSILLVCDTYRFVLPMVPDLPCCPWIQASLALLEVQVDPVDLK